MNRLLVFVIASSGLVLVYLLHESRLETQRVWSGLKNAEAEKIELQNRLAETQKRTVEESEIEKLRGHQTEALKLRAEVSALKEKLKSAESAVENLKAQNPSTAAANELEKALKLDSLPEDNPEVSVHKTGLMKARLAQNGAVLAGGWPSESGRRMFVIIRPNREEGSANQVSVGSTWFEVSEEAANKLRIHLDGSGEQMQVLPEFSTKQFMDALDKAGGGDVLNAPGVITVSGRQARVQITEEHNTASGPVEFGPRVNVLPTLAEDNSTLEIGFRAAMVETRKQ